MLGPDLCAKVGGAQRALLRLFFHREGVSPYTTNWASIAPPLWRRAQREAEVLGGQEMQQVMAELALSQNAEVLWAVADAALATMLWFEIEKDGLRVSLFAVIATFGKAHDVMAGELRIETLFPADAMTEAILRAAAAAG